MIKKIIRKIKSLFKPKKESSLFDESLYKLWDNPYDEHWNDY